MSFSADERSDFIKGYVYALTWTALIVDRELYDETGETGCDAYAYGYEDLDAEARATVERVCDMFIVANSDLLAEYAEQMDGTDPDGSGWGQQAGYDFWMTREGHGVGFWDRDLGELGRKLTDAAHTFGEADIFPVLNDDGTISF